MVFDTNVVLTMGARAVKSAGKVGQISPKKVKAIRARNRSKSIATSRIYAWGLAAGGALGIPELLDPQRHNHYKRPFTHVPCRVPLADKLANITHLASGFGFMLLGRGRQSPEKDRLLFGCGVNTNCQLGPPRFGVVDSVTGQRERKRREWFLEPMEIRLPFDQPTTSRLTGLACGRAHSLVSTSEGLFTMGNNAHGQCGRRPIADEDYGINETIHKIPIECFAGNIAKVVCGYDHSVVLTSEGRVHCFGLGTDGQLGNGQHVANWTPEVAVESGDLQGQLVTDIAGCADTVLALNNSGELFAWGNSEYGQIYSNPDPLPQSALPRHLPFHRPIIAIAAGGSSCALLTDQGDVYVWGFGVLGQGPEVTHRDRPSLLPAPLFGRNEMDTSATVVDIQAGPMHFAAINNRGRLFTWGKNRYGILGLGHEDDQYFPFPVAVAGDVRQVSCGSDHTAAITGDIDSGLSTEIP